MNLKVNTFASEVGSFDLTGSGLESISCLGKSFTKSGQSLVANLSDCVSLATISMLEYCADQDQIVATIKDGFISTDAVLTKVACDSMNHGSCETATCRSASKVDFFLDDICACQ